MANTLREINQIPVFRPLIADDELMAAESALKAGWLGMGSLVGEFETQIEAALEIDPSEDLHVVAVSTGHAALHLALLLSGVQPGDEVIVASFNNVADFQAILAVGASPVFADIDPETLCIDPDHLASLISDRSKVLIAMDYAAHLCDHEQLRSFAQAHGLTVLHDAAHSFGADYNGTPVGKIHDLTMFSFDPVKTLTSVDGGALVVRGRQAKQQLHEMRLIGMQQPSKVMYRNARAWTYNVERLGFRYHMSNLHAAIGLAQLEKLDVIRTSRAATYRRLIAGMAGNPLVRVPNPALVSRSPFLFYLRVLDNRREEFREHLSGLRIDTGIHWSPGHEFSLFQDVRRGPLNVTEVVAREIVSLPLHSSMDSDDENRLIQAVCSFGSS